MRRPTRAEGIMMTLRVRAATAIQLDDLNTFAVISTHPGVHRIPPRRLTVCARGSRATAYATPATRVG